MGIVSRIKSVFHRALHYLNPKKRFHKTRKGGVKSRGAHGHQNAVHINSINKIMLSMINKERRKHSNLLLLSYDHDLELHAVRWSKHMAHQKRLSHSGTILENACMVPAIGSQYEITKSMFYCWKKSKPHWSWMMDARISKAGFGYTIRDKYAYGAFAFDNPH